MSEPKYQTVPLLECAAEFRAGLLGSDSSKWMCFAVCAPLQAILSMYGHETTLQHGIIIDKDDNEIHHTWLALPDGQILDPTADQFEQPNGEPMPEIYFGARPDWYLVEEVKA